MVREFLKYCALCALSAALCSCSEPQVQQTMSQAAIVSPRPAPPGAPPQILYAHFSTTTVARDGWWSGRFVTGTNVASLVLSMPFFSFEIPRTAYGEFSFRTRVRDVPGLYHQRVYGSLIAYNAAGRASTQPVSFVFE